MGTKEYKVFLILYTSGFKYINMYNLRIILNLEVLVVNLRGRVQYLTKKKTEYLFCILLFIERKTIL